MASPVVAAWFGELGQKAQQIAKEAEEQGRPITCHMSIADEVRRRRRRRRRRRVGWCRPLVGDEEVVRSSSSTSEK